MARTTDSITVIVVAFTYYSWPQNWLAL